jgi:hypothetical protein
MGLICEVGILFRGFTVVSCQYQQTMSSEIDKDLRSGLLSAIIMFAENAFSSSTMEYLESDKFIIAFTQDKMKAIDSLGPEIVLGYCILNKKKKLEKKIHTRIKPLLSQALVAFKSRYVGYNVSEVSLFQGFKHYLNELFMAKSASLQKLKTIF